MKLQVKNFSGEFSSKYDVDYELLNDQNVSLRLNIVFNGNKIEADSIFSSCVILNDGGKKSYKENVQFVLEQAKEKWGLELLITEDLKSA